MSSTEHHPRARMDKVLIALFSAGVGALLRGVIQALVGRYAAFKEAQGLVAGLRAEIRSLIELVRTRRYPEILDGTIPRLETGATATAADFFSPAVTQEYFQVFRSAVPKIGLLKGASESTVKAYVLAQSVLEDFLLLDKQRLRVEEGSQVPDTQWLLAATRELRDVLALAPAAGDEALLALKRIESRRWLRFIP